MSQSSKYMFAAQPYIFDVSRKRLSALKTFQFWM